jgi:hypothetical protein
MVVTLITMRATPPCHGSEAPQPGVAMKSEPAAPVVRVKAEALTRKNSGKARQKGDGRVGSPHISISNTGCLDP